MIGSTLADLRAYIESLADASGRYYVVCGRTGVRPVPADDLFFGDREIARLAARATEQYRNALREYDPRTPHYDVIVCEELSPFPSTQATPVASVEKLRPDREGTSGPFGAPAGDRG